MKEILSEVALSYKIGESQYFLQAGKQDAFFEFHIIETGGKVALEIIPVAKPVACIEFTIEIHFATSICQWRNHNYQWVSIHNDRIANDYSPKILKLSDGTYIQAGNTWGCWESKKKYKKVLYWHYHTVGLQPIFFFNPDRLFYQPAISIKEKLRFDLLITKKSPVEWSRSPHPFSAIFCLTDHCDFDSLLLLEQQRELLRKYNLKISKGFFLYHFSKRDWNVAYDNPKGSEELQKWKNEGHELFYHALSQSIKPREAAMNDFRKFQVPELLSPIRIWVDHGYHPYNFTVQQGEKAQKDWLRNASSKGLDIFWNYYDSTDDAHTINQIGVEQFCPSAVLKLKINWREKLRLLLYYHGDEQCVFAYRQWVGKLKSFLLNPILSNMLRLLKSTFAMAPLISMEIKKWIFKPNSRSPYFKYTPLIFTYPGMPGIKIFQTIAIKNFPNAFSKHSLDNFIQEAGVCIAHTYLASQELHHTGRLFLNEKGEIKAEIFESWHRLANMISEKKIWNPVLSDLVNWTENYSKVSFTLNEEGEVIYKGPIEVPVRTIHD